MSAATRTTLAARLTALALAASCVAVGPWAVPGSAAAASPAVATGTDFSTSPIPSTTSLSGVLEVPTAIGGVTAGIQNFAQWRDKAVQSVTAYTGTSTWTSITGITAQGQTQYFAGNGAHVSWSIPLVPSNNSDTLRNAAAGLDNARYKAIAQQLVAGGDGSATLRLGWETGGNWFVWSGYWDAASYVGAFRQAVTAMRSVPGANFTFDWNYALDTTDPDALYPGDAYVDYIGADVYDESWSSSFPASDHAAVWNELLTEQWGLDWLAGFAQSHGKRLSIPEWGLVYRCDGHGGGDDPAFVRNMSQWIATHDVAYADYANGDNSSCEKYAIENGAATNTTFPNASAEYQLLFGPLAVTPPAGVPTVSAPTLPAAPSLPVTAPTVAVPSAPKVSIPPHPLPSAPRLGSSPVPSASVPSVAIPLPTTAAIAPPLPSTPVSGAPVLMISERSDRSDALPITSVVANGPSYVFLDVPGAVAVVFALDGTPLQLEATAPFDLRGNPDGSASPVTFSPGTHQLSATVTLPDGSQQTYRATFAAS